MQINYDSEVDRNYEAFAAALPSIIRKHGGEFALLSEARIVGYFPDAVQAYSRGYNEFGEGNFAVQQVTDEIEDLGFYSYAGGTGQA